MKLLMLEWPLQHGVGGAAGRGVEGGGPATGRSSCCLLVYCGPRANGSGPGGRRWGSGFGLWLWGVTIGTLRLHHHFLGTVSIVYQGVSLQMLKFAGLGLSNDDPRDRYVIFDFEGFHGDIFLPQNPDIILSWIVLVLLIFFITIDA